MLLLPHNPVYTLLLRTRHCTAFAWIGASLILSLIELSLDLAGYNQAFAANMDSIVL